MAVEAGVQYQTTLGAAITLTTAKDGYAMHHKIGGPKLFSNCFD